jgi:hypothetical protein
MRFIMQAGPELSTIDNSKLITWSIASLALVVSFLSFGLSALSLYLQRRDRKPKLGIELEHTYIQPSTISQLPVGKAQPIPNFTILARNATDKTIKMRKTVFIDGKRGCFNLPMDWEQITEVPSHEMKTAIISVIKFNAWARLMKMSKPEKGYFLLTDHLNNKYKTPKLGDSLSLEPKSL